MEASGDASWLLLMHQLPPKPTYVRVKTWRRLQALGAVAIKNSVYVLPNTADAREDFEWVLREIVAQGGDATLCEARLIDGLRDEEVQRSFNDARDADYRALADAARTLAARLPRGAVSDGRRAQFDGEVGRLRRRLSDVVEIDFFGAPGREAAEGRIRGLEGRLRPAGATSKRAPARYAVADLRGRVWVTRKGIHIDRMASAWLIRRFVDDAARFKFVPAKGYAPGAQEIRFDMFDAEFTHDGDLCTFEVLIARLALADRALVPIAEIVHDIDLKDAKFGRSEAVGVERVVTGIALAHDDDETRLAHGTAVFDGLYAYFKRTKE